jgi:hypothetical protein
LIKAHIRTTKGPAPATSEFEPIALNPAGADGVGGALLAPVRTKARRISPFAMPVGAVMVVFVRLA